MINIQKALGVASKFLGNDKIQKALALSKTVKSPQDAFKILSQLGDPNKIISNGLNTLNSPNAKKLASMFGANEQQLDSLKTEILGIKNQGNQGQVNKKTEPINSKDSRIQDLLKGLK